MGLPETASGNSVWRGKGCRFLGQYICTGYDTFGPFKLVGGLRKGHPDANEIKGAVRFFEEFE